jgi:hypothetical protein
MYKVVEELHLEVLEQERLHATGLVALSLGSKVAGV